MHSVVLITPVAMLNAANALGEGMGYGPGSYSVALSPTGVEPATHYGLHTWATAGFVETLSGPPPSPEAGAVIAALIVSVRDDMTGHWSDVLAANGLMEFRPEGMML